MTARMPKVVVVGGSYVDMAIKCSRIPLPGQIVAGSALSYTTDGPGPNQAAEAALCGCEVHLISKVGGDPFAQMVKDTLAAYKVNTDYIYTAEAKNTGIIVTLVDAEGENAVCTDSGANNALLSQDIEAAEEVIAHADVCLIHGRLPQEAIVTTIRCGKLGRTKVILNPARPIESRTETAQPVGDLPIEYFSADILVANLYEAANIAEHATTVTSRREMAKLIGSDLVARGLESAVVTMGKRGCMVIDRKGADHIPAFEVELVDQAGRGDAFAGALAAHYATRHDVRQAVKFARAAGALACTKFGALEAMPKKEEIIQLLQTQEID